MRLLAMRRPLLAIGLAVALLGAAACGSEGTASVDSGSGSTPPRAPKVADLDGRTFLSQSVTESGAPRAMAGDQPISMTFQGKVLRATPACNTTGGTYSLDGARLEMAEMSSTVMGCDGGPLEAQDAWFSTLLQSGPSLALDGDQLTLTGGGTVIVFIDREQADPDRPLVGTDWKLEALLDAPVASSVPAGVTVTLRLPDEATITWQACNRSNGQIASLDGTSFTVGQVSQTEMACPDARSQVEAEMSAVLQGRVDYEIEGPVLHLRNGSKGLDLRAA